jgi:hypothetical protein
MRLQECVQVIEDDARLHRHRLRIGVEGDHLVQVLAHVDHERGAHRLAAL